MVIMQILNGWISYEHSIAANRRSNAMFNYSLTAFETINIFLFLNAFQQKYKIKSYEACYRVLHLYTKYT